MEKWLEERGLTKLPEGKKFVAYGLLFLCFCFLALLGVAFVMEAVGSILSYGMYTHP